MKYNIQKAIEILQRTPESMEVLLQGISDEWIRSNEGENTWSPYEIIGHLIHGEKTDWIPRAKIILSDSDSKVFEPFDRFAQSKENQERPIQDLLSEFKERRAANLEELNALNLDETKMKGKGIHPDLGETTLEQLLSTWVVHDLGHLSQISRVMAKQYKGEVGPWQKYLGILKD